MLMAHIIIIAEIDQEMSRKKVTGGGGGGGRRRKRWMMAVTDLETGAS